MNTDTEGLTTIHSLDNNILGQVQCSFANGYAQTACDSSSTHRRPSYSTHCFPVYVPDVLVTRYEWLWVLNNGIMSRPSSSEPAVSALPPVDIDIVVRVVF